MGVAWLYYGAVLLTTTILETGYDPHCGEEIHQEIHNKKYYTPYIHSQDFSQSRVTLSSLNSFE